MQPPEVSGPRLNVFAKVIPPTAFRDTNQSKSPRGIRGFKLSSGNFTEWKVQGKIGGYKECVYRGPLHAFLTIMFRFPDRVRGLYNEGGLFGERAGWHLPGFDTSAWESRDISDGLPNSVAGVGFFVANFDLHIEEGLDVPMSFTFAEEFGQPYRALLFVNGWQMGKRIGNLGYVLPSCMGADLMYCKSASNVPGTSRHTRLQWYKVSVTHVYGTR